MKEEEEVVFHFVGGCWCIYPTVSVITVDGRLDEESIFIM